MNNQLTELLTNYGKIAQSGLTASGIMIRIPHPLTGKLPEQYALIHGSSPEHS